jgi:seryl-tRNA synthetase
MTCTVTIPFEEPVNDMAREEILKQVAQLNASLKTPRIPTDGSRLEFDVPAEQVENTRQHAERLCAVIRRSLQRVERKVVYTTRAMSEPALDGKPVPDLNQVGIHSAGQGRVMLEGIALQLFRYFDGALARLETPWAPHQLLTPTLIPAGVLAKCDYFSSFPNSLTFACHLQPDVNLINAFRARHNHKPAVDPQALTEMAPPEACLSPAVCYHVYHCLENKMLAQEGIAYSVRGKCFRYEGSNLREMTRLWDFTMRELVFVGPREHVLEQRQRCIECVGAFLDDLEMAAEIRTASDPFFIAPEAPSKAYFQLTAETKYEISALLQDNQRLAIGSLNYHTDFFGRAFNIRMEGNGYAHSVCTAFGLERLVWAFLARHGGEPGDWPRDLRRAVLSARLETVPEDSRLG